jgi:hypothetical protein
VICSQLQHRDVAQQRDAGFPALSGQLSHLALSTEAQSYQLLTNAALQT